uniref:Ig-like domain-containing protein n=1 Tax=Poecilia mexicana TaxID=48701 RepID=A0A3B3YCX6_9TELE
MSPKHFRELSLSIVVTIEVFYVLHFQHECCCLMLLIVTIISIVILFSSPEPPENVSFSIIPSEPLTEGTKVTLQCDVLNVVPVANLIVTFYRGQTPLGQVKSNDATKEPVNETFSLSYNTRKEDDGVQFWCEAKLELGFDRLGILNHFCSPFLYFSAENFIPFIIGAVVAAAVVILIGSGIIYSFYYKQNKMGEYRPTDAFCLDTRHHPRVSLC